MIRALSGIYGGAMMAAAGGGGGGGGDPYFSSVKLLAGMEGANHATSYTAEVGGAANFQSIAELSTNTAKFGSTSLRLPGSNPYIYFPATAGLANPSGGGTYNGEFTVEGWIWIPSADTEWSMMSQWSSGAQASWALYGTAGTIKMRINNGSGGTTDASWTGALTTNVWHHLAADRDATGKVRLYLNGTMIASVALSTSTGPGPSDRPVYCGAVQDFIGSLDLFGHLDELRITKGVARYASDSGFTVPAAAFPRS